MKGIIALDIDGTIMVPRHQIEPEVIDFLNKLVQEGWVIIFITGRPYEWGINILKILPFPFYLAVHNGAMVYEMPSLKLIFKQYLNQDIFPAMDLICQDEPSDYVIYTSYENNHVCYYRPKNFSKDLLDYIQRRSVEFKEEWVPVETLDLVPENEFPAVKCFGDLESSLRIADKIERQLGLHVPVIKDPFTGNLYVVQATHPEVSKGDVLKNFKKFLKFDGLVIAAGDDNNDRSMLQMADIRVVMATAPFDMLKSAHVIAPGAHEKGIVTGLSQAIALSLNGRQRL